MAFNYDWQSDGFSFITGKQSQPIAKKQKKRKNEATAQPVQGVQVMEDVDAAIESANKKLRMCPQDEEQQVAAVPAVDPANLKSALKTSSKSKKQSVSFVDTTFDREFDDHLSEMDEENGDATILKQEERKMAKTDKKRKRKELKKIEKAKQSDHSASGNSSQIGVTPNKKTQSNDLQSSLSNSKYIELKSAADQPLSQQSKSELKKRKLKSISPVASEDLITEKTKVASSETKQKKRKKNKTQTVVCSNNLNSQVSEMNNVTQNKAQLITSPVEQDSTIMNKKKKQISTTEAMNKPPKPEVNKKNGEGMQTTEAINICSKSSPDFESNTKKEITPTSLKSESKKNAKVVQQEMSKMQQMKLADQKKKTNFDKKSNKQNLLDITDNTKKMNKNAKSKPVSSVEEMDSDADWSDVEDDGPEVYEYDSEDDHTLDDNFHDDLKALMAELNFEQARKVIENDDEEEEEEDEVCEEGSVDEEEGSVDEEEGSADEEKGSADEVEGSTDGEGSFTDNAGSSNTNKKEVSNNSYEDGEKSVVQQEEAQASKVELPKKEMAKEKVHATKAVDTAKLKASLALFAKLPSSAAAGSTALAMTAPATTVTATASSEKAASQTLAQKMQTKLNVAKFRMINQQLYSTTGAEAMELFKRDPESFRVYHDGFKSQVALWPLNPLDVIVDWLKQQPRNWVVADFGCGEAELSERVQQKVHSLDLVATKPHVTVCDMAHTPLQSQSVNAAVFCLSLMGTNVSDFIAEANRTLKVTGALKIAEVESRISNMDEFIANVQKFGFKCNKKPINHNYFITMEFKKFKHIKNKENLPQIKLRPCLYKKR